MNRSEYTIDSTTLNTIDDDLEFHGNWFAEPDAHGRLIRIAPDKVHKAADRYIVKVAERVVVVFDHSELVHLQIKRAEGVTNDHNQQA